MSQTFEVHRPLEEAYQRSIEFAIELIDPVTLERVSRGVKVIAEGLRRKPIVNASGMFVWLKEDTTALREIRIDPGVLPYQVNTIPKHKLKLPPLPPNELPLTAIELQPRADYVFSVGTTGIRGTLIEAGVAEQVPVRDAEVGLQWLDDDGTTWHTGPSLSRTNDKGDFVSIIRLAQVHVPNLDASGKMTVRLRAKRGGASERHSDPVQIPLGRVSDPSSIDKLIFAWNELQP